ncbi:MAG: hypothetical protein D6696_16630 [Acidobacteria bacterium]|nr:MAG: hypothetical protein D6696_16630 [Acidobacteriota bacterium]
MHRPASPPIAIALLALLLAASAGAQPSDGPDDSFTKGLGGGDKRFSIAVGAGIVNPDGNSDEEPFFSLALRIRLQSWRGDRVRGYLEPDVGFWQVSQDFGRDDHLDVEVTSAGLGYVVAFGGKRLESFFGAGIGAYREEVRIVGGGVGVVVDDSQTNLGGYLQLGLDYRFADRAAVFVLSRIDFVDSDSFDQQTKLYGGLRFSF